MCVCCAMHKTSETVVRAKIRFGSMVFSVPVYLSSVPKFLIELYL
ncbi:hypothetical protein APHWEB_0397 [Anaplasma phagocytophilum str. Webster]|nr:hypothetical protein APHWEB_0397 [Anaplasma phagocytophilum str. Webster]